MPDKPDFEHLSRKYADLGFNLSPEQLEWFAPRIESAAAAYEVVRSIAVSSHEPAIALDLTRYKPI